MLESLYTLTCPGKGRSNVVCHSFALCYERILFYLVLYMRNDDLLDSHRGIMIEHRKSTLRDNAVSLRACHDPATFALLAEVGFFSSVGGISDPVRPFRIASTLSTITASMPS